MRENEKVLRRLIVVTSIFEIDLGNAVDYIFVRTPVFYSGCILSPNRSGGRFKYAV